MDAPVREFIVQIKPSLAHFEFREHDLLAVGRHAPADFYGAESLLVKPDCFCRIAYNQMRRDGMDCRFRMFRGGRHVSSFCSDVSEMLPKTPASLPLLYSSVAAPQLDGLEGFASCGQRLVSHSLLRRTGAPIFSKIPEALEHRAGDQRQRHRGVIKNFGEPPALFGRNEFAPGDCFSVRAAAQPAPMHRLRADAHPVVVAFQGKILVPAARQQLGVHAELLRPVARHSPPTVKIPMRFVASMVSANFSKSSKGSKRSSGRFSFCREILCSAKSIPSSESLKAGTKTGTLRSYADLRIPLPGKFLCRYSPMRR